MIGVQDGWRYLNRKLRNSDMHFNRNNMFGTLKLELKTFQLEGYPKSVGLKQRGQIGWGGYHDIQRETNARNHQIKY